MTKRQLDRIALWLSIAGSLLAPALAIGPHWSGEYNPGLAVLTATLVVIIWYTYFTYRGASREEQTLLEVSLQGDDPARRLLHFQVRNLSRQRVASCRLVVHFIRSGTVIPLNEGFQDVEEHALIVAPGQEVTRALRVEPLKATEGKYGPRVDPAEETEGYLRLIVRWRDDLGYEGAVGPSFWKITLGDVRPHRMFNKREINLRFQPQGPRP